MTTFWIIAAALAVIALLTVAWPLLKSNQEPGSGASRSDLNVSLYRDQLAELGEDRRTGRLGDVQYERARGELERRLLDDLPDTEAPAAAPVSRRPRAAAVAAGIAVPLLAVLMYFAIGNPASLSPQQGAGPHGVDLQQIDAMIGQLAARLEMNPKDGDGWIMLARSQATLGRFGEASSAYAKSVAIFPDDAQLLADYADTLAMSRGRRLQGEPEELIERALRADPSNVKALALAGSIAFENKDFAEAVKRWERIQGLIPSDSDFANSVRASIAEAKGLAGAGADKRPRTAVPGEG